MKRRVSIKQAVTATLHTLLNALLIVIGIGIVAVSMLCLVGCIISLSIATCDILWGDATKINIKGYAIVMIIASSEITLLWLICILRQIYKKNQIRKQKENLAKKYSSLKSKLDEMRKEVIDKDAIIEELNWQLTNVSKREKE